MKLHFEEIYFNNLPLDIRQAALDESQKMKAMLDMQQPKEPSCRKCVLLFRLNFTYVCDDVIRIVVFVVSSSRMLLIAFGCGKYIS